MTDDEEEENEVDYGSVDEADDGNSKTDQMRRKLRKMGKKDDGTADPRHATFHELHMAAVLANAGFRSHPRKRIFAGDRYDRCILKFFERAENVTTVRASRNLEYIRPFRHYSRFLAAVRKTPKPLYTPFEPARRKRRTLYVKGAIESVLPCCSRRMEQGREVYFPRKCQERDVIEQATRTMMQSNGGQTVLVLAQCVLPDFSTDQDTHDKRVELDRLTSSYMARRELCFLGMIAIRSETIRDIEETLRVAREKVGLTVVFCSNSHRETVNAVAFRVGLEQQMDNRELSVTSALSVREQLRLHERRLNQHPVDAQRLFQEERHGVGAEPLILHRADPDARVSLVSTIQKGGGVVAVVDRHESKGKSNAAFEQADVGVMMNSLRPIPHVEGQAATVRMRSNDLFDFVEGCRLIPLVFRNALVYGTAYHLQFVLAVAVSVIFFLYVGWSVPRASPLHLLMVSAFTHTGVFNVLIRGHMMSKQVKDEPLTPIVSRRLFSLTLPVAAMHIVAYVIAYGMVWLQLNPNQSPTTFLEAGPAQVAPAQTAWNEEDGTTMYVESTNDQARGEAFLTEYGEVRAVVFLTIVLGQLAVFLYMSKVWRVGTGVFRSLSYVSMMIVLTVLAMVFASTGFGNNMLGFTLPIASWLLIALLGFALPAVYLLGLHFHVYSWMLQKVGLKDGPKDTTPVHVRYSIAESDIGDIAREEEDAMDEEEAQL